MLSKTKATYNLSKYPNHEQFYMEEAIYSIDRVSNSNQTNVVL
jgi:hypothetical protein